MTASRRALLFAALAAVALGFLFGGAVPVASAQAISVSSANPPSGEQGSVGFAVTISGKGFKDGAKVRFFKSGTTDPAGVNVRSTQFVSSTQLFATIDIADTAALSNFDIQVQNADGRTGKGTELFSVTVKGDGSGYTLQVLATPLGVTRASVRSINDNHEIVGTVGGGVSQRAAYWSSANAAPVLLPCLSEPCSSVARTINATGTISGTANDQAVVWRWNGTGWSVEALPYPGTGDPAYRSSAGAVLDDGTTVGFYALSYGIMYPHDIPVRWLSGILSEYPMPAGGYFSGRALLVNENGDAAGELRWNDGLDPTYVYGVIWIQEGAGQRSIVLNWLVTGITPRFADGSFLVSSPSGRIRVSPSGSYIAEASGPGLGINRLGDMTGHLPKKGWTGYGGMPYLLILDGTLIKLPIPSSATGTTSCVSTDGWVGGDFLIRGVYYAAVWRPQ